MSSLNSDCQFYTNLISGRFGGSGNMTSLALIAQSYNHNDGGAANEGCFDMGFDTEGPKMVTVSTRTEDIITSHEEGNTGKGESDIEVPSGSVHHDMNDWNTITSYLYVQMEIEIGNNELQLQEVAETSPQQQQQHGIDPVDDEDDPKMSSPSRSNESCLSPPPQQSIEVTSSKNVERGNMSRENGNRSPPYKSNDSYTPPIHNQAGNAERYNLRYRKSKTSQCPPKTFECEAVAVEQPRPLSCPNKNDIKKITIGPIESESERPWKCMKCNRSYKRPGDLRQHENHAHGRKPGRTKSYCRICMKMFSRECSLAIHMRSHTNEKPFQCPSCPARFRHKQHAIRHLRQLHDKKMNASAIGSLREMKNSRRTPQHLEELCNVLRPCKLQLDRCDPLLRTYETTTKTGTVDHAGILKKNKSLLCLVCWKSFSNKGTLTRHEKLHSGETAPHKCPKCSKKFNRKDNLTWHIKNVHKIGGRRRQYKCQLCDKSYFENRYLKMHMLGAHSEEKVFKCEECNKRYGYYRSLRKHQVKFHAAA